MTTSLNQKILTICYQSEADQLATTHERTEPVLLDVLERPDMLDDLMKSHDVVVSLLPWTIHHKIAERCIANKVNMVTASYQSDALKV